LVAADRPSFYGRVDNSLDEKGRLVVPARFRDRLGAKFVLTVVLPDPCLALYPAETWADYRQAIEKSTVNDAGFRNFKRLLFAHTDDDVSCDSQGRVILPAALRAYASIEKEIVTNGNDTRVEIWSRDLFERNVLPYATELIEASASGKFDYAATIGLP
jgi:MraZ protein